MSSPNEETNNTDNERANEHQRNESSNKDKEHDQSSSQNREDNEQNEEQEKDEQEQEQEEDEDKEMEQDEEDDDQLIPFDRRTILPLYKNNIESLFNEGQYPQPGQDTVFDYSKDLEIKVSKNRNAALNDTDKKILKEFKDNFLKNLQNNDQMPHNQRFQEHKMQQYKMLRQNQLQTLNQNFSEAKMKQMNLSGDKLQKYIQTCSDFLGVFQEDPDFEFIFLHYADFQSNLLQAEPAKKFNHNSLRLLKLLSNVLNDFNMLKAFVNLCMNSMYFKPLLLFKEGDNLINYYNTCNFKFLCHCYGIWTVFSKDENNKQFNDICAVTYTEWLNGMHHYYNKQKNKIKQKNSKKPKKNPPFYHLYWPSKTENSNRLKLLKFSTIANFMQFAINTYFVPRRLEWCNTRDYIDKSTDFDKKQLQFIHTTAYVKRCFDQLVKVPRVKKEINKVLSKFTFCYNWSVVQKYSSITMWWHGKKPIMDQLCYLLSEVSVDAIDFGTINTWLKRALIAPQSLYISWQEQRCMLMKKKYNVDNNHLLTAKGKQELKDLYKRQKESVKKLQEEAITKKKKNKQRSKHKLLDIFENESVPLSAFNDDKEIDDNDLSIDDEQDDEHKENEFVSKNKTKPTSKSDNKFITYILIFFFFPSLYLAIYI